MLFDIQETVIKKIIKANRIVDQGEKLKKLSKLISLLEEIRLLEAEQKNNSSEK